MKSFSRIFLVICFLSSGCSLHTFLPGNRFDFPETHEKWLWGSAEVRIQGTSRIELIPDITSSPPQLANSKIAPEGTLINDMGFSVNMGIVKKLDIFFKLPVAPSPPLLGIKFQFLGPSYDKRKKNEWASSLTFAGGYSRQEADVQNAGVQTHYGAQSWAFDGALIVGYRPEKNILLYGGPFYTQLSADGTVIQLGNAYTTSGRGQQWGFNLGATYGFGAFNLAAEVAFVNLSWSFNQSINQPYGGLALSREF